MQPLRETRIHILPQLFRRHPLVGDQLLRLQSYRGVLSDHTSIVHVVGRVSPHASRQTVKNQQKTPRGKPQTQLFLHLTETPRFRGLPGLNGATGQNPPVLIVGLHQQKLTVLVADDCARR